MNKKNDTTTEEKVEKMPTCGIVRPIAAIDGCTDSHWIEVHNILCDAIRDAGFEPNLVSNASESGIIQKRIIENLYSNEIVVCDISAKNPNVMLELGMRLAFDKPTIVVKDDATSFSFDTSPIEHVLYRRDLRFNSVIEFKESLTKKIMATYAKAKSDASYSTFLKHFGTFKVAKIEQKEVSKEDYIIESLKSLTNEVTALRNHKLLATDEFSSAKAIAEYSTNSYPSHEHYLAHHITFENLSAEGAIEFKNSINRNLQTGRIKSKTINGESGILIDIPKILDRATVLNIIENCSEFAGLKLKNISTHPADVWTEVRFHTRLSKNT